MKTRTELENCIKEVYDELVHVKYLSLNNLLTDDKLSTVLNKCFSSIEQTDVIQL